MGARVWTIAVAALGIAIAAAGAATANDVVRYRSTVSGEAGLPVACGTASAESTPQLRADPSHPRRMVAVYLDHGGDAAVGARSRDGGRSWRRLAVPEATACSGGPESRQYLVNPYLAVGFGGNALFGNSYAGNDGPFFRYAVLSHRLPWNAGWESPVRLDPGADGQDAAVVFDPRNRRRADFVWNRTTQVPNPFTYLPFGDRLMNARSSDGGRSFGDPQVVAASEPGTFFDNPALERSGRDVRVVAVRRPDATDLAELGVSVATGEPLAAELDVDVFRSVAGGPWQRTPSIATGSLIEIDNPENGNRHGAGLTDFAAGPGGRLAFADAPQAGPAGGTIELTLSEDGGLSWKDPMATVRLPGQAMLPAVAVGRRGRLGLLWTDLRRDEDDDDEWTADVWFASSHNDGRSWKRIHVDGPIDLNRGYQEGVAYDGGPLGVAQDLIARRRGFAAAYTVTPPLAHGVTDVRFARITPGR